MHHRFRPVAHRFVYSVFSLYLDLDELDEVRRRSWLLGVERLGLLSFRNRDHGPRDGSALKPWVLDELSKEGIVLERPRIMLLCMPRIFGYVFNPLSIYFCHDGERLAAILYEVKNTFGGQHTYAFPISGERGPEAPMAHGCDKAFYVSPFIQMAARYRFTLREPGEKLAVVIKEHDTEGLFFIASQIGDRAPLRDATLLRALLGDCVMTFKVFAGIHLEALRLWRKGAPYHPA